MDFLQYSDGSNTLQDISKLIKVNIEETKKIYNTLKENSLLK